MKVKRAAYDITLKYKVEIMKSKIKENIILTRVPYINEKWNLENKIVYDIGLRRI